MTWLLRAGEIRWSRPRSIRRNRILEIRSPNMWLSLTVNSDSGMNKNRKTGRNTSSENLSLYMSLKKETPEILLGKGEGFMYWVLFVLELVDLWFWITFSVFFVVFAMRRTDFHRPVITRHHLHVYIYETWSLLLVGLALTPPSTRGPGLLLDQGGPPSPRPDAGT